MLFLIPKWCRTVSVTEEQGFNKGVVHLDNYGASAIWLWGGSHIIRGGGGEVAMRWEGLGGDFV